jgi:hypothetical protein
LDPLVVGFFLFWPNAQKKQAEAEELNNALNLG